MGGLVSGRFVRICEECRQTNKHERHEAVRQSVGSGENQCEENQNCRHDDEFCFPGSRFVSQPIKMRFNRGPRAFGSLLGHDDESLVEAGEFRIADPNGNAARIDDTAQHRQIVLAVADRQRIFLKHHQSRRFVLKRQRALCASMHLFCWPAKYRRQWNS